MRSPDLNVNFRAQGRTSNVERKTLPFFLFYAALAPLWLLADLISGKLPSLEAALCTLRCAMRALLIPYYIRLSSSIPIPKFLGKKSQRWNR